jgi:hypothetical protein
MEYFMFNDPILNTFNQSMAEDQQRRPGVELIKVERVETYPLCEILQKHLPRGPVDLMDVDAEGLDLEVLGSNDWSRWRPGVLLVEEFGDDIEAIVAAPIFAFLRERDYRLIGRTGTTSIYASCGVGHFG